MERLEEEANNDDIAKSSNANAPPLWDVDKKQEDVDSDAKDATSGDATTVVTGAVKKM
ncbi:hypothetical protein PC129_g850 [Phytophthora cactorum]|uniref:Uncharacterized protein n=1 Tax=Phytophthora cactorum TaxID=29920 RepID=A0A8T1IVR0_9STRA|nr:hypothetical protein PC113_g2652 [Phytophthora cactorum]KAG2935497.1 hypothetical protein PC114_g585 [Phytophthora cactorum]KAG2952643.1 hypothetical protein PC117_g2685 [Phytophthora cactorum]KAG3041129.1 hypothetical protein PC119_g940 [Phytophthora cactorum]KAG3102936.1 hypothetical protein PC122_g1993 [Phytophthora cactorum]